MSHPSHNSFGSSDAPSQVVAAVRAELPLADGLRALADSATSSHERRRLLRAAERIEQGGSFAEALANWTSSGLLKVIVSPQMSTGDQATLLTQIIEQQQRIQLIRRQTLNALIYPGFILVAGIIVGFGLPMLVVRDYETLFTEFGLRIPQPTKWMLGIGIRASPIVLVTLAASLLMALLARLLLRPALWDGLLSVIPLLGPIWVWTGVAQTQRWLGILVGARVPLPNALRLAGNQVDSPDAIHGCEILARIVENGARLSHAVQASRVWPNAVLPVLGWGEQCGSLSDGLAASAEMLEGRARSRGHWIRYTIPPFVFVFISTMVISVFVGCLLPLIELLFRL